MCYFDSLVAVADCAKFGFGHNEPMPITRSIFTYKNHAKQIQLHVCRSVTEFECALQYLVGAKVIGLDVEYMPCGSRRAMKLVPSEESDNFVATSHLIGKRVLAEYSSPEQTPILVQKNGMTTGLKLTNDIYLRLSHYNKARMSVIQLASESHIIVAHVAQFNTKSDVVDLDEFIPPTLKTILEDPSVLKAGVAIKGDAEVIAHYGGVVCKSLFELDDLDKILLPRDQPGNTAGLETLTKRYLNKGLIGKKTTSISEWHLPRELSSEQIDYAANDALLGVELFNTMQEEYLHYAAWENLPPFPATFDATPFDFGTSHKKTAARLPPPPPQNTLDRAAAGGSTTLAKALARRAKMHPLDASLDAKLANLRDTILAEKGLTMTSQHHHAVLENRLIHRIAEASPRPVTAEAIKALVTEKAWGRMGDMVERFIEVVGSVPQSRNIESDGDESDQLSVTSESSGVQS